MATGEKVSNSSGAGSHGRKNWPKTIFDGPKNFIITERCPDGKYLPALNREALDELKQIEDKLVVISAVGAYRTGKSYLLSRMSQMVHGARFTVGHKSMPETKGLWLMIVDHPTLPHHKLALLDTEGIGDTVKGDSQHDAMLFVLTCLLSDTMIYNGIRAIDEAAFEKLNFTAEMSNYLVSKTKKEGDDDNFHNVFPELVYVVRDCHVKLEVDGREITPDEYFENALAVGESDDKTAPRAKTRNSIKKYFQRRKCFTLDIPAASRKVLSNMDTVADDQLNEDFIATMDDLTRYALLKSKSRALQNGRKINGRQVAMLVETYVNAYRKNEVPNISSALENLKAQENRNALEKAKAIYTSAMELLKEKMPTDSVDDVEKTHETMLKLITERIHEDAILENDDVEEFVKKLVNVLNKKKEFYNQENKRLSKEKCDATLKAFYGQLQAKKANEYNRPGGYQEYRTDMKDLKQKYKEKTGLGVMKHAILLEFMEDKRAEEDGILATDNALTENQRKVEEKKQETEQARAESIRLEMQCQEAERNAILLKQRQELNEQLMNTMQKKMENETKARVRMEEEYEHFKRERALESQKLAELMKERRPEDKATSVIEALSGLTDLATNLTKLVVTIAESGDDD